MNDIRCRKLKIQGLQNAHGPQTPDLWDRHGLGVAGCLTGVLWETRPRLGHCIFLEGLGEDK